MQIRWKLWAGCQGLLPLGNTLLSGPNMIHVRFACAVPDNRAVVLQLETVADSAANAIPSTRGLVV